MNIDWSKAPEGATHYNCENEYFYRFQPKAEVWFGPGINEWANAAAPTPEQYGNDKWLVKADPQEQTRQEIIDLAAKRCGISGDSIRQLATVLAAEGYRKFEIVEEDV